MAKRFRLKKGLTQEEKAAGILDGCYQRVNEKDEFPFQEHIHFFYPEKLLSDEQGELWQNSDRVCQFINGTQAQAVNGVHEFCIKYRIKLSKNKINQAYHNHYT